MAHWIKFKHKDAIHMGILNDREIECYEGDMFSNPSDIGKRINLDEVELINPCNPSKMIALWNNYKTLADEKGLSNQIIRYI